LSDTDEIAEHVNAEQFIAQALRQRIDKYYVEEFLGQFRVIDGLMYNKEAPLPTREAPVDFIEPFRSYEYCAILS